VFDLRALRQRAGLTQTELGRLAGVAPSNLSAIEAGRRPASPAMQRRLREAMLRPSDRLREHRAEIARLVEQHGCSNPRVFGSTARGEDTPESDLDLLVNVPRGTRWALAAPALLAEDLEQLLGIHVDVVSEGGLKPKHAAILAEATPL